MKTFYAYIACRIATQLPAVREVSNYFPKAELNRMFRQEILVLLNRPELNASPSDRSDIESMADMDAVGYIDRSLRRAGFSEPDLDQHAQDILIKMLVTGKLFSGYKTGSFRARFLVTVKNAVRSLLSKQRLRSRQHSLAVDLAVADQPDSEMIDDFRSFLLDQHGPAHLAVFDQRIEGGESKALIGSDGIQTSYRLKKITQEIKQALRRFANGDSAFRRLVDRAMQDESETMTRRFSRR